MPTRQSWKPLESSVMHRLEFHHDPTGQHYDLFAKLEGSWQSWMTGMTPVYPRARELGCNTSVYFWPQLQVDPPTALIQSKLKAPEEDAGSPPVCWPGLIPDPLPTVSAGIWLTPNDDTLHIFCSPLQLTPNYLHTCINVTYSMAKTGMQCHKLWEFTSCHFCTKVYVWSVCVLLLPFSEVWNPREQARNCCSCHTDKWGSWLCWGYTMQTEEVTTK